MTPSLLTFDIFGTVVDWRLGLSQAVGRPLADDTFDRIVDHQGAEEQRAFRPYREIVADSLVAVLGFDRNRADAIGRDAGHWPLYPDSREGLRRLMEVAPCVAMTNSDREHGEQVQRQLGFRLSGWVCAEDVGVYKPSAGSWEATARIRGATFGPHWWHVSAYADYDLVPATRLGLSTVFIPRPHARPGPATVTARDLVKLADRISRSGRTGS